MAGRACGGAPASALHVHVILLSNVEEVIAWADEKSIWVPFLVNEGHFEPERGVGTGGEGEEKTLRSAFGGKLPENW